MGRVGCSLVVGVALLASATAAGAQTSNPVWVQRPATLPTDTPSFAAIMRLEGRVAVRCIARVIGPPEDCVVTSEAPEGLGFGEAALRVVARGVINPGEVDGVIVDRNMVTTIRFSAEIDAELPMVPRDWPPPAAGRMVLARLLAGALIDGDPVFGDLGWIDLEPARRAEVLKMVEQVRLERTAMTERMARVLARSYTVGELARLLIGRPPGCAPDPSATFPYRLRHLNPTYRLRDLYCARWLCSDE